MPIRSGGKAPYAPPDTVLSLIRTYRGRGLQTPFTSDVLTRAGVPETLVVRVTQSLKLLDLIDESLNPTQDFEALRRVGEAEFPARLAALIKSAYAEVFQFVDPATDGDQRVRDAFRAFEPLGQLTRMVTLFMGLCAAAGIIPEGSTRKQTPPGNGKKPAKKPAASRRSSDSGKGGEATHVTAVRGVDPVFVVALQKLPPSGTGWTKEERDRWLAWFTMNLDYAVPIGVASDHSGTDENDE